MVELGGFFPMNLYGDWVVAVPEPSGLALVGLGIAGLGFMRKRKAKV